MQHVGESMTVGAVVALALGSAAIVLAVHRLFALRDDTLEGRRRLARTAQRELLRQEQDTHPVDRTSWTPYRRHEVMRGRTSALWKEVRIP